MSVAFVFPGQGSQSVGMLRALSAVSPTIEATFGEASQVLGYDLWQRCQEGPPDALNATECTQPAMLTAGIATYRVWRERGGAVPAFMAGHSLGEFSALVAAGCLDFATAVALVKFRAEAMQAAVPQGAGAMAAVLGLEDADVEAACREARGEADSNDVIEAVNFNAPGQVVIAGTAGAVARATEAQTLLLQTQKHEAIGRLSGGVAHDFNNMLQTLSTALHVLGVVTTDERGKKMLDAANRAVGKAAQLVQQMLVFGRAQPLTPKVIEFSNFLIRSQELLTRALGNGIVVAASLAADLRPLLADETQLELALLNLAFNSRDAMPSGGNLLIEALNRDLDEGNTLDLPPGRYVELRVVDTGEGVPGEELEKVFEPYFTTKPVGKGSGLGLAQVQSFVQQSGGRVSISSELKRGTTVAMLLPAAVVGAREDGEATAGESLVDGAVLEVLFVEDDVLAASVVRHALEQLGHHVTHAGTARDALAQLQLRRFDILFTDIVMPGDMSGLDLALQVQRDWPAMAVVVATGYAAQSVPRDQVRLISKPYTIDTVRRAFAAAISVASQVTPSVTGRI